MLTLRVDDMTCGHCASSISKAVHSVEPGATVEVDLAQHLVRVGAGEAAAPSVIAAIRDAGYAPVPVTASPTGAPKKGGCCCGSGRSSCRA